jgi:glucuronate isomerase
VLATTDDQCDDLAAHSAVAADPGWEGQGGPDVPAGRLSGAGQPGWAERVRRLGETAGVDTGSYPGYVRALEERRHYFVDHGATSADHSHVDVGTAW